MNIINSQWWSEYSVTFHSDSFFREVQFHILPILWVTGTNGIFLSRPHSPVRAMMAAETYLCLLLFSYSVNSLLFWVSVLFLIWVTNLHMPISLYIHPFLTLTLHSWGKLQLFIEWMTSTDTNFLFTFTIKTTEIHGSTLYTTTRLYSLLVWYLYNFQHSWLK